MPNKHTFIKKIPIAPLAEGALSGLSFAVKDVFDIQGYKTGFGHKAFADTVSEALTHAELVSKLLTLGAKCTGKLNLSAFCLGIEGANLDYGMPLNPVNADLVPGGSSSGTGAAVGHGEVDFAVGTDMAGSIRVPACYCGQYGLRFTPGALSMQGCLSLSARLDGVGIIARTLPLLQTVAKALLTKLPACSDKAKPTTLIILDDLLANSHPDVCQLVKAYIEKTAKQLSLDVVHHNLSDIDLPECSISDTLRGLLAYDTKNNMPAGYSSFPARPMRAVNKEKITALQHYGEIYIQRLDKLLEKSVICLPTVADFPRKRSEVLSDSATLFNYKRLTPYIALSNVAKLPQLTLPLIKENKPIGVSFIGQQYADLQLLSLLTSK